MLSFGYKPNHSVVPDKHMQHSHRCGLTWQYTKRPLLPNTHLSQTTFNKKPSPSINTCDFTYILSSCRLTQARSSGAPIKNHLYKAAVQAPSGNIGISLVEHPTLTVSIPLSSITTCESTPLFVFLQPFCACEITRTKSPSKTKKLDIFGKCRKKIRRAH